jgi:hypothetical protein
MSMMELMRETYPRTKATKHSAFCERIPIRMFEIAEAALRVEMRQRGYRAMYRGSRVSNDTYSKPTMTRRRDATHVLLYRK